MKKIIPALLGLLLSSSAIYAKNYKDSLSIALDEYAKVVDSVNASFHWQTNSVIIAKGIANLNLGVDYKFLDTKESNYILHDLWGNPPRIDVLGMIFPANSGPLQENSYAFIVTYDEAGYVKDDDADKIDYKQMCLLHNSHPVHKDICKWALHESILKYARKKTLH